MPTVVQDVSGDSALQTAIAALKAKIEAAEESGDIAQLISDINTALAGKQNTLTFDSTPSSGSSNPVTSGGVKTALDGKQDTLIFDNEPTAESTKPVTSGGVKEALDEQYQELNDRLVAAEDAIDIRASGIYDTASGSIVSLIDGADDIPLKKCVVNIEPIQEGSGDPSPENVRPIIGRTGLSVVRAGKNLLPADSFQNATKQGLTYTVNADGTVSVSGTATTNSYITYNVTFPVNVIINGIPEINEGVIDGTAIQIYSEEAGIGTTLRSNNNTFVLLANHLVEIRLRVNSGVTLNNALFKPMARISTDTDYSFEPYKGSTYSVNWETEAGTVYGGSLDIVSGKLTVDRAIVDLGTLNWMYGENENRFVSTGIKNTIKKVYDPSILLCIALKPNKAPVEVTTATGDTTICVDMNGYLYVRWLAYADAASFKAAMSGVMLVYELASPTEIQLTPQEFHTLLGVNNIWSDGGDSEVEYPADTKLYIQRLTGSDEDDMVANSNIPDATYFLINNTLYKSTAAIASGDPVVPGTNCTVTNLAEALNALNTTT